MAQDKKNEKVPNSMKVEDKTESKKNDLCLLQIKLVSRCGLKFQDRLMHAERRKRANLLKETTENQDPFARRNKDFVKNEYGLSDKSSDEKILQAKSRQNLMMSPALQDLQKQLTMAKTSKEIKQQLDEKERQRNRLMKKEADEAEELQKYIKRCAEEDEASRVEQEKQKLKYRMLLQDQIINKYKLKQEEYKNVLKERALMEDVQRCILEEDQMELFRRQRILKKTNKDIEDFRKARALWTLREKEMQEEEERKVNDFIEVKNKFLEETKEKRRLIDEKLSKRKEIVAKIVSESQNLKSQNEMDALRRNQEEMERKDQDKQQLEEKNLLENKKKFIESFTAQIEDKEERDRIQKQIETDYIQKNLDNIHKQNEFDKILAANKRQKKIDMRNSIVQDIQEKLIRNKLKHQEDIELMKREQNANKERIRIIEEERLRILKEETPSLIGFLPPGLIKPSDMPALPEDVRNFYWNKH